MATPLTQDINHVSGEFDIVEQKTVTFYDDELIAIRASDGQIYVSVRQMCDSLGLDTQGQTRRMDRHDILATGLQGVANLATPGGMQKAYVLCCLGFRWRTNSMHRDRVTYWWFRPRQNTI